MPKEIAPDVALSFSPEAVHLQRRIDSEWQEVDHVRFDDEDMRVRLEAMRDILLTEGHDGLLLIIPDDQLLYTRLAVDAMGPADMPQAVIRALDGLTPYAINELAFDWLPSVPGEVYVAAVARQTLQEARQFSERYGFIINGFIADPDPERFPGEPHFDFSDASDVISDAGDDLDAADYVSPPSEAVHDGVKADEPTEAAAGDVVADEARIAASISKLRELAAAHEAAAGAAPFYGAESDFEDDFYESGYHASFPRQPEPELETEPESWPEVVVDEAPHTDAALVPVAESGDNKLQQKQRVFVTRIPPSIPYPDLVSVTASEVVADVAGDVAGDVAPVVTRPPSAVTEGKVAPKILKADKPSATVVAGDARSASVKKVAEVRQVEPAPIVRHGSADGDGEDFLPRLPFLQRIFSGQNGVFFALLVLLVIAMLLIGMFAGGDKTGDEAPAVEGPAVTGPAVTPPEELPLDIEDGLVPDMEEGGLTDPSLPQPVLPEGVEEDPLVDALREAIGHVDTVAPAEAATSEPVDGSPSGAPLSDAATESATSSTSDTSAPVDAAVPPAAPEAPPEAAGQSVTAAPVTAAPVTTEPVTPSAGATPTGTMPAGTTDAQLPEAGTPPSASAAGAAATAVTPPLRAARPAGKPAAPRATAPRVAAPEAAPSQPVAAVRPPVSTQAPAGARSGDISQPQRPVAASVRPASRPSEAATTPAPATERAVPASRMSPVQGGTSRPPSRPSRSDAGLAVPPPISRSAYLLTPPVYDRAAFSFSIRLARIERFGADTDRIRYAQARPGRKPGGGATIVDAPVARASGAASTVPMAASTVTGPLSRSQRPATRPGNAVATAAQDQGSLALEQAMAAAIKDNPAVATASASPSPVPGALRASALPPRRSAAFVGAAAAAVAAAPRAVQAVPAAVLAATPAPAAIDADLQAQAEARFRARADADAQTEARARAEAEARARAQAAAEERSARARGGAYRPVEVDDEPELASIGSGTSNAQAGQAATVSRGLDPRRTTLIGVVGAGKASRGLIRLRNGKIVTVRIGDRIDGGAITSIGEGVVTYNVGGRARQLRILDGR